MWKVDLHSHTRWSLDSVTRFERVIQLCEQRGIQRIAITDHNTADGALAMQKLAPDLVIVGEEIMTTQGELLAYFVKESVPAGLTPQETIKRLRDQGAVISVAHPFDRLRKGAWEESDLLQIVESVDAIEIFNARCAFPEDNTCAKAFAETHQRLGTAGSDGHTPSEYGNGYLLMRPFENDPEDFLEALRDAQHGGQLSSWVVHVISKAAKWSKKLGIERREWAGG